MEIEINSNQQAFKLLEQNYFISACFSAILEVNIPSIQITNQGIYQDLQNNFDQKYQNLFEIQYQKLINDYKIEQSQKTNLNNNNIKCTRKQGCQCVQCNFNFEDIHTTQDKTLENIQDFIDPKISNIKKILYIIDNPVKFSNIFQITEVVSNSFEIIIIQEKCLQQLNFLIDHNWNQYNIILIFAFMKSNILLKLINISFSFSDNMRWKALKILINLNMKSNQPDNPIAKHFKNNKNSILNDDNELRLLSDKIYCQLYDLDKWIQEFQRESPKTAIYELDITQIQEIYNLCKISNNEYFNYEKKSNETSGGLKINSSSWLQYLIDIGKINKNEIQNKLISDLNSICDLISENGKFGIFLKLSTRSPKDSKLIQKKYQNLCKNHENFEAIRQSNKCDNFFEGFNFLITSQRIEDDLEAHIKYVGSITNSKLSIIVRRFVDNIPPYCEMRGFICNGRLTAMTQYQDDQKFSWVIENYQIISKLSQQFFEEKIRNKLNHVGILNAIIDIGFIVVDNQIKDIMLIEFNSYGIRSGSGLFEWDNVNDYQVMLNGPFELRIIQ